MAYCTEANIADRLPTTKMAELTDDESGDSVNSSVVTAAITEADAKINMYLRGKHDVPLSTVPDQVKYWSIILSIHNLYKRRIDTAIPETLTDELEVVQQELRDVRDNKLMIDDADSDANTAGYYKTNKTSNSRIFTVNDNQTGSLDKYFSKNRMTPSGGL